MKLKPFNAILDYPSMSIKIQTIIKISSPTKNATITQQGVTLLIF